MLKNIGSTLSNIGGVMAVVGIVSLVLSFFNKNIKYLRWIDRWGDEMGLTIRIGLVLGGIVLFLVFARYQKEEAETDENE